MKNGVICSAGPLTFGESDDVVVDEDGQGFTDPRFPGTEELRQRPAVPVVKLAADSGHRLAEHLGDEHGTQFPQHGSHI